MPFVALRGPTLRIVLDTNVVISGLLWRGPPHRLLEVIEQDEDIEIVSSPILLRELAIVLNRPSLSRQMKRQKLSAASLLEKYAEAVELVSPASVARIVPDDPDDDHVIAAAVAGGADLIVSGDKHLLGIGMYQGIRILQPADAVSLIMA